MIERLQTLGVFAVCCELVADGIQSGILVVREDKSEQIVSLLDPDTENRHTVKLPPSGTYYDRKLPYATF